MTWQNPYYLWLLILLPLLIGGIWWNRKKLRQQREKYFSLPLFDKLSKGFWSLGRRLKSLSLYIGLAFLMVGLAGPKIGTQVKQVKRQGVDLLIALDLSASMNAEDVKPSRLEKAKYEISRLIDRLKGDRVGLIVFTGDAYLQAPMTLDYSALRLFLNIADTDQMPNSATDFSAAMETGLKAYDDTSDKNDQKSTKPAKVMLIISDGENHGQSYSEALSALTGQDISVYTLGIGSKSGSTIPVYNKSGSLKGYKHDKKGDVITTNLEPDVLQGIARQGNGKYYAIESGNAGIDAFLARLDDLQQGEFSSKEYADYKNQYQWLAGIGLGLLIVSLVIPLYRKEKYDGE